MFTINIHKEKVLFNELGTPGEPRGRWDRAPRCREYSIPETPALPKPGVSNFKKLVASQVLVRCTAGPCTGASNNPGFWPRAASWSIHRSFSGIDIFRIDQKKLFLYLSWRYCNIVLLVRRMFFKKSKTWPSGVTKPQNQSGVNN